MSRVQIPSDSDDLPVSYVLREHGGASGEALFELSRTVYDATQLSLREMEAARVRTAYINGCLICQQGQAARDFDTNLAGSKPFSRPMTSRGEAPDQAFYDQVVEWRNSDIFSPRERLAIEFAERMGEAPQSMQGDEAFWDQMHAVFSDKEIVDLTISIASWIAMGRFTHTLELDTFCAIRPAATLAA